jgi:enoyl-CoA hydratase/carnithine racemase
LSASSPRIFTARELASFLVAPDAGERLSPLMGPGHMVLDLDADVLPASEVWRERIAEALPTLPCVTIALLSSDAEGPARTLADRCDVRLVEPEALESLLAGFAATPIAALAYVQLLRGSATRSISEGLVAESFVYSTLQAGQEFRHWLEGRRRRKRVTPAAEGAACRMERSRGVLEILLTRPAKHNAFSRAMRDALSEALQLALADPSIDRIQLRGEGDSFCSGGDLDEFGSFPDPAYAHAIRTTRSPALLLAQLAGRSGAEVHGACIGAGVELPAFTDHVVAREDAFFALPEVGLGLVPGAGGTVSLPRRIGRQRTAWLGLGGARIDARTALAWGLIDEVRISQGDPGSEPESVSVPAG